MEATNMKSVEKNIASVALADIQPSNYNPRKTFDEASLAELADSIRQQGVLQPIGVRPIDENRFEVVFGERRYRASLMAGLETVPAVGTASYGGFSCQITLSQKGRILQEMHFKPTDQARLPTFASDKTNGR